MRVRDGEGRGVEFNGDDGGRLTLLGSTPPSGSPDTVHLNPTLAHALGRALLVYANRNGVGRETLDEAPRVPVGDPNAVSEEYRRAVRDWTVTGPGSDPGAPR